MKRNHVSWTTKCILFAWFFCFLVTGDLNNMVFGILFTNFFSCLLNFLFFSCMIVTEITVFHSSQYILSCLETIHRDIFLNVGVKKSQTRRNILYYYGLKLLNFKHTCCTKWSSNWLPTLHRHKLKDVHKNLNWNYFRLFLYC